MGRRKGWKESKFKVSLDLDRRLRKLAVELNLSMDTCIRMAMKRYAGAKRVSLPGGSKKEILRRSPETILGRESDKIWISFPAEWSPGLEKLLGMNEEYHQLAQVWRIATINWVKAMEKELASKAKDEA